ncbi:MAG: phosphate ABC transporter ATP-binding protein [Alphaproteobacteria bacterium]|jgi:tungstate transport system ATP-binding protein|nr:ABC transporter ATP-binding protein [Rhodospirillaceae bacterium]MDP6406046.1 phosphate ABC transporter ATP-binding protein [Alphaproteobacteria bacterium]MDP6622874.1 phosphate ABC transporter ATP-binding protein [Alphaproteobacteria bacterium]|tara:strand:+ start:1929 stop:2660 length:732 start_codon:yes stop_codon:yes gene_type:complete
MVPEIATGASILPLEVSQLTFEAGGSALLDGVDFVLAAGSRSVILGANGAGKSLTLRLCHGLLAPSRGRVNWQRPAAEAARRQAMVFQRPVLLRRTVAANVAYGLALQGVPRGRRRQLVAEALEVAGLGALAGRPARSLSGGEQQRLALARAWALGPEVLFLDEPTASLDPAGTRAVEELIDAFHTGGAKIVMTTHDLAQARRLADEVLFFHQGRLLEQSPAERFFAAPSSLVARRFLAGEVV